jgi:HD-GYP domain-containing protein (c-di-GMP phosphodiesterase class II)
LRGEEIPLTSRIVSIVDAYDAMTHGRPYRRPVDPEEAFRELRRCAGSQFEGSLVDIFVKEVSAEARIIRLDSDMMR